MSTRRDEITEVARGIFASRGFRNTTMRDIADGCDLLAGSLYSHFKSKNEILQLILDPFFSHLIPVQEKAAAQGGTGADRLEAMIRGVFPVLFEYGEEMAILHYNWFEMVGVDEFHDILAQSRYTLVLWSQVINAGIEDGSLRAEIDADVTVRVVTSSLHGLIDPKRYESLPSPVSATGFDGLVDEFVTTMMHGLDQNSFSTSSSQHSRISSKK
jgi:AcrR family transcriptional regulator